MLSVHIYFSREDTKKITLGVEQLSLWHYCHKSILATTTQVACSDFERKVFFVFTEKTERKYSFGWCIESCLRFRIRFIFIDFATRAIFWTSLKTKLFATQNLSYRLIILNNFSISSLSKQYFIAKLSFQEFFDLPELNIFIVKLNFRP